MTERADIQRVVNVQEISPTSLYPLKQAVKHLNMGYQTALSKINTGTFPLPYKKQHARLIVIKGSDMIKFLEGGDWVEPIQPAYHQVG